MQVAERQQRVPFLFVCNVSLYVYKKKSIYSRYHIKRKAYFLLHSNTSRHFYRKMIVKYNVLNIYLI